MTDPSPESFSYQYWQISGKCNTCNAPVGTAAIGDRTQGGAEINFTNSQALSHQIVGRCQHPDIVVTSISTISEEQAASMQEEE